MQVEPTAALHAESGPGLRSPSLGNIASFVLKLIVTLACFWYVARAVHPADFVRLTASLDPAWFSTAVLLLAAGLPLTGYRWFLILQGLESRAGRALGPMLAITAIGVFFAQVAINLVGDGIRVWMLSRLGDDWRVGVTSVLIDRGIGVAVLFALGFAFLLFPSGLTALGGHRVLVLEVFGALLAAAAIGLAVTPYAAPILNRWRTTRWIAMLAAASHRVLFRSHNRFGIVGIAFLVHSLTIAAVWALGRAMGLDLGLLDAGVLFTVMIAISVLSISIGGWGLRELAIVGLLSSYGLAPEKALFFSVSFGLIVLIASLPGAVVWALYRPAQVES